MEVFKFTSTTGSPFLGGEVINKAQRKTWIERYRNPGEFKLESPLSSGLREALPIGTFISHVDTKEVMIVEDHSLKDETTKQPMISITGRSLDVVIDNRIVGANYAVGTPAPPPTEYVLAAAPLGQQVATMISQHIVLGQVTDPNDEIPYLVVSNAIPSEGEQVARAVKRSSLYKAALELLEIGNYGIKTIRQPDGTVNLELHKGNDRSATVSFAWKFGELKSSEYLFSTRKNKNTALVRGRYVELMVTTAGATKFNRRVLLVEASDLDDYMDETPTGIELDMIRSKMTVRGQEAIQTNNDVNIVRADISEMTRFRYRQDFEVGDIVSIEGGWGASDNRRVTEYTEIEDENGETGHPTLEMLQ